MIDTKNILHIVITVIVFFCATSPASGQDNDERNYFYARGAWAFSSYYGDLNRINSDDPFFSYALKFGGGYFFTPEFAFGFDYRVADYPRTIRPNVRGYTKNHTVNLYIKYSFIREDEMYPYVLAGLGMTFFGTYDKDPNFAPAFGPMVGVGANVRLTDRLSMFFEAKLDFVLDDEAMDEMSGSAGFDALGFFGIGLSFDLRSAFIPITDMYIEGPSVMRVAQPVMFELELEGNPTEPVTVHWDLGDGNRALGKSISHVYREAGTYTVRVRVSNRRSEKEMQQEIEVEELPVDASIVYLETEEWTYEAGVPVTFEVEVLGTGPVNYSWDFGDGTTSTELSPEHTYEVPGIYRVTLRVDNTDVAGRTGVDQRSVTVYVR